MTDQPTSAATTAYADMRIEVVKRELNQGALAGFDSAVTDYAARLVIAALDSFEASTVQLAYERGVAEGRRQATEGHPDSYPIGVDRGFAIAIEMLRDDARYERWWSALPQDHPDYGYWSQQPRRQFADYLAAVGPWEPTEQPDPHLAEPRNDRYMMATEAHHKLGDMSRDVPDLAIIYGAGETETDYVGQWVSGMGLINMRFPKATTRDLTAEERERYRRRVIDEAGAVRPIVIEERTEQPAARELGVQEDNHG